MATRVTAGLAIALALVFGRAPAGASVLEALGEWPLCEASAAVPLPSAPDRALVADNEDRQDLFVFDVTPDGLASMRPIPLRSAASVRDIEALAAVGDRILVIGSHSPDKKCEFKKGRWRFQWLREGSEGSLVGDGSIDSSSASRSLETAASCLDALFGGALVAGAKGVCDALSRAEAEATKRACTKLNVEGAVFLPEPKAAGRVWLGLRSPLVDGRAILLRWVDDSSGLRFDGVATIDLGGRGVRELALHGDTVWGIAGPSLDADEPFFLWGIPVNDLQPGAVLDSPLRQALLPTSSEGLIVDGNRAVILADGDVGHWDHACGEKSHQTVVALPTAE